MSQTKGIHALMIDQAVTEEGKKWRRNLPTAWIDYRKAYDMTPHGPPEGGQGSQIGLTSTKEADPKVEDAAGTARRKWHGESPDQVSQRSIPGGLLVPTVLLPECGAAVTCTQGRGRI